MTTEERRNSIEAMVKEKGELDVKLIRERFEISNVTVRNDLMFLERKGTINRQFGKAVVRGDRIADMDAKRIINLDAKEKIGKFAASMVSDNDSIFLYTGSTTLQIARFIPLKTNFIAATNCIYIAHELRKYQSAKIVFIGGNLSLETGATFGAQVIKQLELYNIDKLFLAVNGIDAESGVTNDSLYETDINFALIKKAKKVIVVADHTKIGVTRFIHMGRIEDVDVLITDGKASETAVKALRDKGVEVHAV